MDEEHPSKKPRLEEKEEEEEEEEEDEDIEEVWVRYRARSQESTTEQEESFAVLNGSTENEQPLLPPPIPPRVNSTRENQSPEEDPFLELGGGERGSPLPPPLPMKQRKVLSYNPFPPPLPPPPPPQEPERGPTNEQPHLTDELTEVERIVSHPPPSGTPDELQSHPSMPMEETREEEERVEETREEEKREDTMEEMRGEEEREKREDIMVETREEEEREKREDVRKEEREKELVGEATSNTTGDIR